MEHGHVGFGSDLVVSAADSEATPLGTGAKEVDEVANSSSLH
jgi:hypothetical protein